MALANGNGKGQQQPQPVGPETVDSFKTDVERVTARAARLSKKLAYFFLAELSRNRLVKNRAGGLEVRLAHLQTNAANRIGQKPVHAHQVAVGQPALDARPLQLALRQQGLRNITKGLNGHKRGRRWRVWMQVTSGHGSQASNS